MFDPNNLTPAQRKATERLRAMFRGEPDPYPPPGFAVPTGDHLVAEQLPATFAIPDVTPTRQLLQAEQGKPGAKDAGAGLPFAVPTEGTR